VPPLPARIARQTRLFFQWPRLLGLAGTALLAWLLVFVVLRHTDMGWMLPKVPRTYHWPALPHFLVWQQPASDGREETVYTVPARKLTAQEMAPLTATNRPSGNPPR
jgi:hypothetical protein